VVILADRNQQEMVALEACLRLKAKKEAALGTDFKDTFKKLGWEPFPRQQTALDLFGQGVYWMLYGGAVGGGKSVFLRNLGVAFCRKYSGSRAFLFRRTYPELRDTHEIPIQALPPDFGYYAKADHIFTFTNGSILQLAYCDKEPDLERFMSKEFQLLLFDESTHAPFPWILKLSSRVRTPIEGVPLTIVMATNPGGVGHADTRRYFVKSAPPEVVHDVQIENLTDRAVFVPSKISDNIPLMKTDPNYAKRLGVLDEKTRRAYIDGDWDVFVGQYFTQWSDRHIVETFTPPKHWRKWGGLDWGYAKPLAFGLFAKDPDTGRVFMFAELYKTLLRDAEAIERIMSMVGIYEIDTVAADPSMWARKSDDSGMSTAEKYVAAGIPLTPANNDRLTGWRHLREFLADGPDGPPMFQVTRNCQGFIETFPTLVHDNANPEDLDTDGSDHSADMARYSLLTTLNAAETARRGTTQRQFLVER